MRPALLPAFLASLVIVLAAPALAAEPEPNGRPAPDDKAALSKLVAETSDNDECRAVRRRLWVEERGWVIRRVRICH